MASRGKLRSLGPLAWYYVATPLFALADVLWGINIRVSALDDLPALKYGYYALCLACGALTVVRPSLTAVVAMAESSVNLGLVILAIPIAYLRVLESIGDGRNAINPFTPTFFANFALSAVVGYTAYARNQLALHREAITKR